MTSFLLLGAFHPHNLFTCVISMRRLFSKYFPRWGSKPLDEWLQTQWNKAPGWSLVLRTGTSGLRRRNLCEVSISFIYSPWWTPPLGVPDSRWGVLVWSTGGASRHQGHTYIYFGLAWAKLFTASLCLNCVLRVIPGPCFSKFAFTLGKKTLNESF